MNLGILIYKVKLNGKPVGLKVISNVVDCVKIKNNILVCQQNFAFVNIWDDCFFWISIHVFRYVCLARNFTFSCLKSSGSRLISEFFFILSPELYLTPISLKSCSFIPSTFWK